MKFYYNREERLKKASPAVRQGAARQGRRGLFSRNPSLRMTLWDLAVILFMAVVIIPLVQWLGARGFSEDFHMILKGRVFQGEVLASLTVVSSGGVQGEDPLEMRVQFYLDGEPAGRVLHDLAPRKRDARRTLRARLPYQGEEKLEAEVLLGEEENRLICSLEPPEKGKKE